MMYFLLTYFSEGLRGLENCATTVSVGATTVPTAFMARNLAAAGMAGLRLRSGSKHMTSRQWYA